MSEPYGQGSYQVRFDWGPVGARAARAEIAVVVDVLSFSTSVCVAVERGTRVFPYRWRDDRAAAFAASQDAQLAVGRLEATKDPSRVAPSLSPAGLLDADLPPRLVLPSPNGSTIAAALDEVGTEVVAIGCLRNASAVAAWLAPQVEAGRSVVVVAAGERWEDDDSLRPALEDQIGAGAVLSGLDTRGMSPEARTAFAAWASAAGGLPATLHECVGGRELTLRGFGVDVDVAAEHDASAVVPVLVDGAFVAAQDA